MQQNPDQPACSKLTRWAGPEPGRAGPLVRFALSPFLLTLPRRPRPRPVSPLSTFLQSLHPPPIAINRRASSSHPATPPRAASLDPGVRSGRGASATLLALPSPAQVSPSQFPAQGFPFAPRLPSSPLRGQTLVAATQWPATGAEEGADP
jgi:hypothetical protein